MQLRFWGSVLLVAGNTLGAQTAPVCKAPPQLAAQLAKQPSAGGYDALGMSFAKKHEFACAISAFESAVKLEPASFEPHYNLGLALRDKGDRSRAIRELRTALRLRPESLPAQNALGITLQESGQLQAAEEAFKKALQIDPLSLFALNGLSTVLIGRSAIP